MGSKFSAVTFRTVGSAGTPQNLFTLQNGDASLHVRIKRLIIQMDATALLTAVMNLYKVARTSDTPSGGTTLTKVAFDTAATASDADIVARGSCSSDGGALSAMSATAGNIAWQQFNMRMHSVVGQVLAPDNALLPLLVDTYDWVLNPSEAIVVQVVGANNPATNHYWVGCVWEEY